VGIDDSRGSLRQPAARAQRRRARVLHEGMTVLVVIVAIAAAMAYPFVRAEGLHEWRIERVAALAGLLRGGRVEAAVARGTLDGVEVAVTLRSPNHGGLAAIARAAGPTGGLSMRIRPRKPGEKLADEIAIDPAFDRDYIVVGAPAERVRALCDDALRARVRAVRRAWVRLDATGARVERPGFSTNREDPAGELAVAQLAAAVIARAAAVGDLASGHAGAYRDGGGAAHDAALAMPEITPKQIWIDEHIFEHKLRMSLAIGAWCAAVVLFAWWAGVGH
jgi:hypothetical protein